MRSARIELAVEDGLLDLSALGEGTIAVYRPQAGDDLTALPKAQLRVITGSFPDHDHFRRQGYAVETGAEASARQAAAHAAAIVCLPRARDMARAMLAQAADEVIPGGQILVDGQKTDGVDSILKELRARVELSPAIAKAHGKIAAFRADASLEDWRAQEREVEGGFITRPGVFSADGPDRGSVLLAEALPPKLGPKVVDLGAGWGYLSAQVLAREGVKRLDLVEAEAEALACARLNIRDARARFHWADALGFRPETYVETVVMNPPFHIGRQADPALGAGFIAAARRMMAPDGVLWMVANRHLPYDPVLTEHFLQHETVGGDNVFRVIRAIKPRRPAR